MDAGESQEIIWTYRWEVHPAPPGVAAWLVDDAGRVESAHPTFLAFQVREASVRAFASIPKFASGARPREQLRFAEPPAHFIEVTGGEHVLSGQEVFAFLPAVIEASERMPWFRVGVNVFFLEEEARRVGKERREASGTAVMVVGAGVRGGGASGGGSEGYEPVE